MCKSDLWLTLNYCFMKISEWAGQCKETNMKGFERKRALRWDPGFVFVFPGREQRNLGRGVVAEALSSLLSQKA